MAVFRLLHFPSAVTSSTQQILSSPIQKPLQPNAIIPCPPVSLSLKKLSVETRKLKFYQFHAQLLSRAQPSAQSSELETVGGRGEEEEEDEVEGEVSKTRLLVENVPWTSTADDLRPIFEKYGTVVEIEVSFFVHECYKVEDLYLLNNSMLGSIVYTLMLFIYLFIFTRFLKWCVCS